MAIHVHLASLLLLAAIPLFAQTNAAPAPGATAAHAPTTDSTAVPKATDADSLSGRRR
jgi:hypothetical protein